MSRPAIACLAGTLALVLALSGLTVRAVVGGRGGTPPAGPYGVGLLNDGTLASAGLIMASQEGYGPLLQVSLVVWRGVGAKAKIVYRKEIGWGWTGTLTPAQLTGSDSVELFVYVDGQKPEAEVLRFRGSKPSVLYHLDGGRPLKVEPRDRPGVATCAMDIVEFWDPWHLGLKNDPRVKGRAYALRVFRWNGRKYVLHHIEGSDCLGGED